MKRTRDADLRRYMRQPENCSVAQEPAVTFDVLAHHVMAALGRTDLRDLYALARTCTTLYRKTPWRKHATYIAGVRHWTPQTFAPFAPHVVEFHYLLPCHHGRPMWLMGCFRLRTLVLYNSNECYPGDWVTPLPPTLRSLVLHSYQLCYIQRAVLAGIEHGQCCLGSCTATRLLTFERREPTPRDLFPTRCTCADRVFPVPEDENDNEDIE